MSELDFDWFIGMFVSSKKSVFPERHVLKKTADFQEILWKFSIGEVFQVEYKLERISHLYVRKVVGQTLWKLIVLCIQNAIITVFQQLPGWIAFKYLRQSRLALS